jgi:hypothetical protein
MAAACRIMAVACSSDDSAAGELIYAVKKGIAIALLTRV